MTDTIQAGHVYRFDVDGAVNAGIGASTGSIGFFRVHCGSVASNGSFTSAGGISWIQTAGDLGGATTSVSAGANIGKIDVDGDLLTSVSAGGRIDEVDVGGDIGTVSSWVDISAGSRIQLIKCYRAWADISVPSTNGALHRIETTGGPFVGTISADYIEPSLFPGAAYSGGFYINGNLDADVTFSRYVAAPWITVTGSLPAGRTLKLGSGWYQGTTFTRQMSFGSIAGQIIVNALGNNPSSQWTGNILVGPSGSQVTLSPNQSQPYQAPYYQVQSSSLGGGAVGLVPYHLHDEDCSPANGHIGNTPLDSTIRLRWYGPISFNSGYPVTVDYWTGSAWSDITGEFTYTVNPTNPRELRIVPDDLFMDWSLVPYRIRPTSNLKCAGTTASTVPSVHLDDVYIVYFE